jgi:hypothetical protein
MYGTQCSISLVINDMGFQKIKARPQIYAIEQEMISKICSLQYVVHISIILSAYTLSKCSTCIDIEHENG